MIILKIRSEVKVTVTRKWYATLRHPKMHQIWNSYLKAYRRYAPYTKRDRRTDRVITIKTKSEVKVKVVVTRKWYATLRCPKMDPNTKFGIPTSKNIGDMHRTRSGTDGQCDYYMPPKVSKNLLHSITFIPLQKEN